MKKKRILFITLFLAKGGAERAVSIFSSELARRGEDVHLILFKRLPNEYPLAKEVKVYEFGWMMNWSKLGLCKRIMQMRQLIRRIAPDIVIPFLAMPTVYTYFGCLGLKKLTFISTVRNNPLLYIERPLMKRLVNYITEKSDKIMLQTQEQRRYFPNKLGSKIFVVPNPVEQQMLDTAYYCRREVKRIVSVGRLNKQKNHTLLIKAFARLSDSFKELSLVIYGEGNDREKLEQLINKLGLRQRVSLPGNIEKVSEELARADLFVLSSDYEGLPNTLIEAMAVGVPCISTACPTGPKDLIQNKRDGLLTRVGDEERLARAMKYLITNFEERQKISMAAKCKIRESFSVSKVVDIFEELLR